MNTKMTKMSIATVVVTVLMIALISTDFVKSYDWLEIISMEAGQIPDAAGVFAIIYFLTLAVNALVCIANKREYFMLTSWLSMIFLIITIVAATKFFKYEMTGAIMYLILNALLVVFAKKNKA